MPNHFLIPYGESNFKALREAGLLYVDKTAFIEKLEHEKRVLFLRPRRFGKSLLVSTLQHYYDVKRAEEFDALFQGLYIYDNPTKSKNNYYVLRFNFSGVATTSLETVMEGFASKVTAGVQEFVSYYNLNFMLDKTTMPSTMLLQLFSYISTQNLEHKVCILIDEYDHFTNAVLNSGLADFINLVEKGGLVRSFYEVIKEYTESQNVIDRLLITGVMSVSLDAMTSGFNIATKLTTDGIYADMIGFTGKEVRDIFSQLNLDESQKQELYNTFRDYYNGYRFSTESDTKVFNSTLIFYYLKHYLKHGVGPRELIDRNLNQNKKNIERLANLSNQKENFQIIESIIKDGVVHGELSPFIGLDEQYSTNDFITLMFNHGLLTIKEHDMATSFEIPNRVMHNIYFDYLSHMLQSENDYAINSNEHQKALVALGMNGNIQPLTDIVLNFLSHLSGRNAQKFDEKYIQLIFKMLLSTTNQYFIYDELPSKQGFSDLAVLKSPVSSAKYEHLVELKYIKKSEDTPEKRKRQISSAKKQIGYYLQDERLQERPDLKCFVLVFIGFESVEIVEVD